ncbi:uncharacterized protein LOC119089731 [Pollicipes pollicipes]|uniref:uncharacterized protein LOC119089731 n=1 Tax=Pollicipes pollicipes TaxID=41117 RepID=UPI0018859C58|nr:uncharacterized protein LOC119089731 [Pollicipes pollicipes]
MMDVQSSSGLVEKKFVCRVCSRTYANLMTFRQHFESHKLSIQCWVCRKLCSRVTNLNAHLRNKHGVHMKQSELRKILKYIEQMGVSAVAEALAAGRLFADPLTGDSADRLTAAPLGDGHSDGAPGNDSFSVGPIDGRVSDRAGDGLLQSDT